VSKAREKSIYATRLANLFSNEIVQSLIDSKRFVSVEYRDFRQEIIFIRFITTMLLTAEMQTSIVAWQFCRAKFVIYINSPRVC